jgi:NAD(P)H-dependent FMN reductase
MSEQITIISATNREDSATLQFSLTLQKTLKDWSVDTDLLDLKELDNIPIQNSMYQKDFQHPKIAALQDKYILPAGKFIFVVPEYNGSYPGLLKYFIDACSIRKYADNFQNKSAFLIGVSSGRAGNLRGLDHLTGVLHYLKTHVYPTKLPVSKVETVFDPEGLMFLDQELIDLLKKELITFVGEPKLVAQGL